MNLVLLEEPDAPLLIDTGRKVGGNLNALLPQIVLRVGDDLIRMGRIDKIVVRLQVKPQTLEIVFLNIGDNVFKGRRALVEQRALRRELGKGEESVGCSYPDDAFRVFIDAVNIVATRADMLIVVLLLC